MRVLILLFVVMAAGLAYAMSGLYLKVLATMIVAAAVLFARARPATLVWALAFFASSWLLAGPLAARLTGYSL